MNTIGTMRPPSVPMVAMIDDVRMPSRLSRVSAQNTTLTPTNTYALLFCRSGSKAKAAVMTVTCRMAGNQMAFSDHCCHTARKPHRSP